MTHDDHGDRRDDPGLPGVHQGDAPGDLGRHHPPRMDRALRLPGPPEYDLRPGGAFRSDASDEMRAMGMAEQLVDGEVIEADPPRRLVQTWRFLWDEQIAAEGPTRVTFEIDEGPGGASRLTVTHELENAPTTAAYLAGEIADAGGGWSWVLSDLKTLLETGAPLPG